jgi:hypothetical protein
MKPFVIHVVGVVSQLPRRRSFGMFQKAAGWIGILALVLVVASPSLLMAKNDREVIKREVELTTEKRVDVELSFGAGSLEVQRARGGELVKATLEFPEDADTPEFSYRKHGRAGDLRIQAGDIEHWEHDDEGYNVEFDDESWDGWWREGDRNDWWIALTDEIPLALRIETGASNNEIDLTGLRISDLDIEAGACELLLTVDRPTNHPTRIISIDGGAAKVRLEGLGNLNFDRMEFNGGAGHFTLDFDGELDHRATVEINLGVGQMNIFVPRDIGVKLDCSSCTLASVSVSGAFDEEDDVYVNERYGRTKGEILFEISASLATVNVETIR